MTWRLGELRSNRSAPSAFMAKRQPVEADPPLPEVTVEDEIRQLTYEIGRGRIRRLDSIETHIRSLVVLAETRVRKQLSRYAEGGVVRQ